MCSPENVAFPRPRCLGALLILTFAFWLACWGTGASSFATASSTWSLGIRISQEDSGRQVLLVRGVSIDDRPSGEYAVTATLGRIPCPGRYRFQSEKENQLNGNSSSLTANVTLSRLSASLGAACGTLLPARPGRATVVLIGESEPLRLTAWRTGVGNFTGRLVLRGLPECDRRYELFSSFELGGWQRTFSYQLKVRDAVLSEQGMTIPAEGCQ